MGADRYCEYERTIERIGREARAAFGDQSPGDVKAQLAAAIARADALEAELLRVRTTGHGAAHELDNIAIECGLGHSPKPGVVTANVRAMREREASAEELVSRLESALDQHIVRAMRAEKERDEAKALYAKAWEECEEWRSIAARQANGCWLCDLPYDQFTHVWLADAHDAARKEAGL